jgi:DmsE family decaheme c-type cytochrome
MKWPALVLLLMLGALFSGSSSAAPAGNHHDELVGKLTDGKYSRRGADTCLKCHDETFPTVDAPFPTAAVFRTAHGQGTKASPFATSDTAVLPAGLQCEACHGPAGDHPTQILEDGETRQAMINFGQRANAQPDLQNSMCLNCHNDTVRMAWRGSNHEGADLACANCHRIHSTDDPVRDHGTQNQTCTSCHRDVAADALKHSAHPLRQGQLNCTDCHAIHGNDGDALTHGDSVTETCTTCHGEKRGPFLWEHAPAAEDCSICHVPHGSSQPALLTRRPPQLCQGCHSSAGHRSLPQFASDVPPAGASEYLLARGCTNCHSAVHGSNHPSGDRLRR